jgi:dipeptidase E
MKYFGEKFGCKIDVLYLIKERSTKKEIEEKILNSDIVYVGGGQTLKMMRVWRKFGVDEILIKAHQKGIVMSGLSTGAICWFSFGNSDSRKFDNPETNLMRVKGLGMVKALFCPHYDVEKKEKLI